MVAFLGCTSTWRKAAKGRTVGAAPVDDSTVCTAACQASLSYTISWSLLKFMSIESVMPSNQLILKKIPSSKPHVPAIPVLGIYTKGLKAGIHRYLYTHIHSSILTTAKMEKQAKCLSVDEWISKTWSAQRNSIQPFKRTKFCHMLQQG